MAINAAALIQSPLSGADFLRSSHIQFRARDGGDKPEVYQTTFQQDFNVFATPPRRTSVHRLPPPEMDHRDLRQIKEIQTEGARAYVPHFPGPISQTPAWTKLLTNLKMPTDPQNISFSTTHEEGYQWVPATSTGPRPTRPAVAMMMSGQKDKALPGTTHSSSYVAHNVVPVLGTKIQNLRITETFQWDKNSDLSCSTYKEAFQGKWFPAPQSAEKSYHSSLAMGDPRKVMETKTTHSASFGQPGATSPVTIKERLKVTLGDFHDNIWTTTTSDAHRQTETDEECVSFWNIAPVVLQRKSCTQSFLPTGDTDLGRNQERMTYTTNRLSFPEVKHSLVLARVDGPSIRTRSNVVLGRPNVSKNLYNTTFQAAFPQKDSVPAKRHAHPPGVRPGQAEPEPALSTVQRDYGPLRSVRQGLSPRQLQQIKESHIKAPEKQQYFGLTHREAFGPKPLSRECLTYRPLQHISHMPF